MFFRLVIFVVVWEDREKNSSGSVGILMLIMLKLVL